MHFERQMPFKIHKIIYFFQKKRCVCLPYLKFSDPLPKTHFYLALVLITVAEDARIFFTIIRVAKFRDQIPDGLQHRAFTSSSGFFYC